MGTGMPGASFRALNPVIASPLAPRTNVPRDGGASSTFSGFGPAAPPLGRADSCRHHRRCPPERPPGAVSLRRHAVDHREPDDSPPLANLRGAATAGGRTDGERAAGAQPLL